MALNISGPYVEYGIVCRDRLLAKASIPVQHTSLTALLAQVETALQTLARQGGVQPTQIAGVTVGICAIVHYAETFIVPAQVGPYRISPLGEANKPLATIKAFVRSSA
jgi:hypothetical protein